MVQRCIRPDFKYFGMFVTYILQSKNVGAYYIGSCANLEIRLHQHNIGRVKATKRYAPWSVVHSESFDTLRDARKREAQIKSWKRRGAIEKLIKHSKIY